MAELFIYDTIGFGGLTSNDFKEQLAGLGNVNEIDVHINSGGGDVFQGIAIGSLLKKHPATINVFIDGLAASIASVIAMAGDTITIAESALMMIHEGHAGLVGEADELRKEADLLDKINSLIAALYADRTGKPVDDIRQLMSDETWFSAQEALEIGLVDFISEPVAVAACAGINKLNFKNVPECYRDSLNTQLEKGTAYKRGQMETEYKVAVDETEVQRRVDEEIKAHKVLMGDIRNECKKLNLDEHADELCDNCKTLDDARKQLIDLASAKQPKLSSISFGLSQQEKSTDAVASALNFRAMNNLGLSSEKKKELAGEMAAGWEDFKYASLNDMGRFCLEEAGINTRGMSQEQIAKASLGFYNAAGIRMDAGYHTPSSFPQLLLDVANKSLLNAFEEAPATYKTVFRQASSVADFKDINRMRLSEGTNLDELPDNEAPNEMALSDKKETYAVRHYSNQVSLSWKTQINDDLDAMTRIPQILGGKASSTVNTLAWAQITANENMSDGTAVFASGHSNLQGSGAPPSIATLNTNKAAMRLQTGMDGGILNIVPHYIVVPAALEGTVKNLINSQFDPGANLNQVFNPHSNLTVVIEPLLDANSSAAWYLFADQNRMDTVEYTFLQGHETPQFRSEMDFKTQAQVFIVSITFAAKAVEHRGLYKDPGE